jgi:hypothetical protein
MTSDSRNRRCLPGADGSDAAEVTHRLTVFGSTPNIPATLPGVSNRSGLTIYRVPRPGPRVVRPFPSG